MLIVFPLVSLTDFGRSHPSLNSFNTLHMISYTFLTFWLETKCSICYYTLSFLSLVSKEIFLDRGSFNFCCNPVPLFQELDFTPTLKTELVFNSTLVRREISRDRESCQAFIQQKEKKKTLSYITSGEKGLPDTTDPFPI